MKKILSIIILFLAGAVFADHYFDQTVTIAPGNNYVKAEFRLVIPEKHEEMTGILMLLPGFNGSSIKSRQLDSGLWIDFAKKHKMALLGLCLQGDQKSIYHNMNGDSAEAFQKALKYFAGESGIPEIEELPFLIKGASAGGQVAYGLAAIWPGKIIAFAAIKGGYYLTKPKALSETAQVPAIIYIGENDTPIRRYNLTQLFSEHRANGAPWVLAVQPGAGHGEGGTDVLTLPFFEEIMRLRTGRAGPKLTPVDFTKSWSSRSDSYGNIQPFDIKEKQNEKIIWLPSEDFGRKWQGFVHKPQIKAGETITLTFPDLPDTLNGDPASCQIRIPENYNPLQPVPMVVWYAGWQGSNKIIGALNLVNPADVLLVGLPYPGTCRIPRLALADGKEDQIWDYQSVMLKKIKKMIPNIDPNNRIAVGSSSGAHFIGTGLAREWPGFTDYFTAYVLYGGGVAPGTTYPGAKGKNVLMAWGVNSEAAESRKLFAERMQASGAKVTVSEIPNTGHPLSNEARVVIKAWIENTVEQNRGK